MEWRRAMNQRKGEEEKELITWPRFAVLQIGVAIRLHARIHGVAEPHAGENTGIRELIVQIDLAVGRCE